MQQIEGAHGKQAKPLGSLILAALMLVPLVARVALTNGNLFTLYQVKTQDLAILLALPLLFAILQRWAPAWKLPTRPPNIGPVVLVGGAVALLLGWGAHALLFDFPISRDEHMVVFDMAVYDKGRLAAPLAPEWRAYAKALVPAFLLNPVQPIGLVSDYLPVNALLRLGFAQIADPAFFNPALALAGGVALFDIAQRLFGADARALWVTMIVYLLSSQMLVNAMTAYAMTGHMALNLIWLAAFLRGGRWGHGAAIVVGFLATGLHQLAFHPLFAAPFVLWRLRQGAWRLALLYASAYLVIIAWWMGFPLLSALQTGTAAGAGGDDSRFFNKVMPLLLARDPLTLSWMMLNMLRFVAWQHLALLPLVLAAIPVARRGGLAAPMMGGILLGLVFVGIVLPYQGHGWGYRYLHPYLGSFALLAGLGYQQLAIKAPTRTDGMVILLSLVTLAGAMPVLMGHARAFTRTHVLLDCYIAARTSDIVLVDTDLSAETSDGTWAISPIDEVRNDPDLANRPLRLASELLDGAMVAELCRRGTVSIVSWRDMHRLGFGTNVISSGRRVQAMTRILRDRGCLVR